MYCILHASKEAGLEDCKSFMLVANQSVNLTIACLLKIRFSTCLLKVCLTLTEPIERLLDAERLTVNA